jgi:hypothetical protein
MLKIVFTSEDNENSMFGIEEFEISTEHASQLMRGDMSIARFLDYSMNGPDDISRLKNLLTEGDVIDHVTVAIKFEPEQNVKEAILTHLSSDLWENIRDLLDSSKDSLNEETLEMIHNNIDAFYKQEVTREVKPYPKKARKKTFLSQ